MKVTGRIQSVNNPPPKMPLGSVVKIPDVKFVLAKFSRLRTFNSSRYILANSLSVLLLSDLKLENHQFEKSDIPEGLNR